MAAAIWSSDLDDVNQMPALFFIRFFQKSWTSVSHRSSSMVHATRGSRSYIAPLTESFRKRIRLETPVKSVRNTSQRVELVTAVGVEKYDAVVLASHSDQSLALLDESERAIRTLLRGIPYADNEVVLHTDHSQMPANRRAWASWNYQIPKKLGWAWCRCHLRYESITKSRWTASVFRNFE